MIERFPWMTVATILFTGSAIVSANMEFMPPELAAELGAWVFAAGAIGKALYQIGVNMGEKSDG